MVTTNPLCCFQQQNWETFTTNCCLKLRFLPFNEKVREPMAVWVCVRVCYCLCVCVSACLRWWCSCCSQCQLYFCCFALPFLQITLHLWQATTAINWLNKSLHIALSARPSKTNPPFVVQHCMQTEHCHNCLSCWLNGGRELSVRQVLFCEAGYKEVRRFTRCSCYYGLDIIIILIWWFRKGRMVP